MSTRPPPRMNGITYSPIIGMNTSSTPASNPGAVSRSVISRNVCVPNIGSCLEDRRREQRPGARLHRPDRLEQPPTPSEAQQRTRNSESESPADLHAQEFMVLISQRHRVESRGGVERGWKPPALG